MPRVLADDLRHAQTLGLYVDLALVTGQSLLAVVLDVNEAVGFVTVAVPEDPSTTSTGRRIALDFIASAFVTEIEVHPPA